MTPNFDEIERTAAVKLIELALDEDLCGQGDLTSEALIDVSQRAEISVVARCHGILAGVPVAEMVFEKLDPDVSWRTRLEDSASLEPGSVIATVVGTLRSLLTGERTVLNFLTHLSGVATLSRAFVDAVRGTKAKVLDTRKTLPGWRQLDKYAVRAGGGTNHRMGLYDGFLIKDNHLSAWAASSADRSIADAVRRARESAREAITVEVEVDTLEQLADALTARPELVLLDNMDCANLRKAVELRDRQAPDVLLEASGRVTLEDVAQIAATGVERISVGALTHSAIALDIAFDWTSSAG